MTARILLVDDDKVLSKAMRLLLEKRGYSVDILNHGSEVAGIELENRYDILLLDIEMPGVSGIQVLESVRANLNKNVLPVIMVTSNEDGESMVKALQKGANDYVTKPVNTQVLVARIATQLEIRKLSLEFAKNKEISALNAMITTYNHEINNPLTIAFGMIEKLGRDETTDQVTLGKLKKSLDRVRDIVKKIRAVADGDEVNFDEYVKDTKMIKL